MKGPEVSVETLSINGECHVIQITDKLTTGAPHFVEMAHSQPTRHSQKIIEQISKIAKAANKAIGIENGPSHTEIIVTTEGPKVVELGARLGGDNITTHLVPFSTGINMVECCIKIALGETIEIIPKWNRGSAIRYFQQKAGIIKKISGIEEAKKIKGVEQIEIVHGVGESITEVCSSGSRMGYIIATADTAKQARSLCEEAMKLIEIEIV